MVILRIIKQYPYRGCVFIFILSILDCPQKGNKKTQCNKQANRYQKNYYFHYNNPFLLAKKLVERTANNTTEIELIGISIAATMGDSNP